MAKPSQQDLWSEVLAAFERHIWKERGDTDALSALNRIAAKVLAPLLLKPLEPANTVIRRVTLSPKGVQALRTYRENAPEPAMDREPIVLLEIAGRYVILDGNRRVGKWRKDQDQRSRAALILTAQDPSQRQSS